MVATVRRPHCALYDRLNNKRVECSFNDSIRHKIFTAVEKESRIEAYGMIRYAEDGIPEQIKIDDIDVFPDPSTLPSADYVKGILRDDWVAPDER